jgi:ATP-binding cassette subfamily B protein
VQLVKFLNIRGKLLNELRKSHRSILKTARKARNFMNKTVFVQSIIMRVPTALVLLVLALSYMAGDITLGALVAAYAVYGRFMNGYSKARSEYATLLNARPGMFKLRNLLENKPKIPEPGSPKKVGEWEKIKFEKVSFNYDGKKKKALHDVSLHVDKGEKLAIVGVSGSGKSTISKLLLRMYLPNEGKVKIGNTDVKDVKSEDLYELIKIVPQENELINTTVFQNLKLGTSKKTSKKEIIEALKKSESLEFVKWMKGRSLGMARILNC